jgi:predicted MFS family arabinose efflux permease
VLLILTFALSAGDAFETPTWRAVIPELVHKDDLAAASALNGIEFNFARAVGPALAGVVIAFSGVGTAFLVNTLSFSAVILVVAAGSVPLSGKRRRRRQSAAPLSQRSAMSATLRRSAPCC